MKKETEGVLAVLAALLVLFSAMMDPLFSFILIVFALGTLAAFRVLAPYR